MNNENLVWLVQTYVTRQLLHILCQMTCSLHAHELLSNYYVMMLWCLFKSQSLLCLDVDDSPKIFMKVSEMILLPPLFSPCERFYLGTHACTHMPRQDIEVSFSFFFSSSNASQATGPADNTRLDYRNNILYFFAYCCPDSRLGR